MGQMSSKEQFRAGFLLRCAEDGRSMDEVHQLVKSAIGPAGPIAGALGVGAGMSLGQGVSKVPDKAMSATMEYMRAPAALAAALLVGATGLGGVAGHTMGKLHSQDVDPKELKQQELLQAYRAHASRIKQLAALKSPQQPVRSSRLLR